MIDYVTLEQIEKMQKIKQALELARKALSHTATDLMHENFEAEEAALVAIDFALEKL